MMENVKENSDLLKWIQNNGAMNLSVVIISSVVDLIINAIRPLDPKRKTILAPFWFSKERLMLLNLLERVFL